MDYQRFLKKLPTLYRHWGTEQVQPKSDRFQSVLSQVQGMTTPNVMQLLNCAVACLEPNEIYCEVGSFRGSTLIGALLDHGDRLAYAVDNFSEFDPSGEGEAILAANLESFDLAEQVCFCNQDFEAFFYDLGQLQSDDRIGVYLYDGAHDYRSQLMGLLLARPFLSDQSIIIVDDSNWSAVQQANWDFIAAHPQCRLELDLATPENGHATFWNGLQILSWDTRRTTACDWDEIQTHRDRELLNAIYNLHFEFEQQREKLIPS
jgi:protein O-GlcNAc transferase